jgi:hypothetical protein
VDEGVPALADLLGRVHLERDEEIAGLVVVDVALVDDRDRPVALGKAVTELVRDHGSGRARAQHHEGLLCGGHGFDGTPMGIGRL